MDERLKRYIENLSDERLFELMENRPDYTEEALALADAEFAKRGLSIPGAEAGPEDEDAEAPPVDVWVKKPVAWKFVEGIFFAYRDFFKNAIGLSLSVTLLGLGLGIVIYVLGELAVGASAFSGGIFWRFLSMIVEGVDLTASPVYYVVSMTVLALFGTFTVFLYRMKYAGKLDEIGVVSYFRDLDGMQIAVFLGTCMAGGMGLWILGLCRELFANAGPAFSDDPSSGDIIVFGINDYAIKLLDLLSLLWPTLVLGVLAAMAVSGKQTMPVFRRGWRYFGLTLLFVFLFDQFTTLVFARFSDYALGIIHSVSPHYAINAVIQVVGYFVFYILLLPAFAAVHGPPFFPDRKDFAPRTDPAEDL